MWYKDKPEVTTLSKLFLFERFGAIKTKAGSVTFSVSLGGKHTYESLKERKGSHMCTLLHYKKG